MIRFGKRVARVAPNGGMQAADAAAPASSVLTTVSRFRSTLVIVCQLCAWFAAPAAAEGRFAARCNALLAQARFAVVLEDAPVVRDNSRTMEALRNLSGQVSGRHNRVYGLTRAQLSVRTRLRTAVLADADGSVCAVPSVELTLGLPELAVYLARELTGACRRGIVQEHEMEHVAVWRNHLRDGAGELEPLLRTRLSQVSRHASADAARTAVQAQVDAVVNPFIQQLQDGIAEANRQLDTPQSYAASTRRFEACAP